MSVKAYFPVARWFDYYSVSKIYYVHFVWYNNIFIFCVKV